MQPMLVINVINKQFVYVVTFKVIGILEDDNMFDPKTGLRSLLQLPFIW